MMKNIKLPKYLKRGLAAFLAVILTVTAFGPFSALTSATYFSLNHIEEIKDEKNENLDSFHVLEILPNYTETTMGYLLNGMDPIKEIADNTQAAVSDDNNYNSKTRKARRVDYMNNTIYKSLENKTVIGANDSYPVTKTNTGYTEYYPWETTKVSDSIRQATDTGEELISLTLDAPDQVDVKGNLERVDVEGGETGDYDMNAVYSLSHKEIFDINQWANSTSATSSNAGVSVTPLPNENGMRVISTDVNDAYTRYGTTSNYYKMEVVPGATYTMSYDVDIAYGQAQCYMFMYDEDMQACVLDADHAAYYLRYFPNGSTYSEAIKKRASSNFILEENVSQRGHYEYTFTIPEATVNNAVPKYIQCRFGTRGLPVVEAKFYNVSIHQYGCGNYVQDVEYFEYVDDNSRDGDENYFYSVTASPLSTMAQWEALGEGVGIYTKEKNEQGTVYYQYLGSTSSNSALDIDANKALNASDPYYFTLTYGAPPTVEKSGVSVDLPVVTNSRDRYHTYIGYSKHDITYNEYGEEIDNGPVFIDVEEGTGYFDSDKIVLEYNPNKGRYTFVQDPNGELETTVTLNETYYTKGLTSNEYFAYQVMDWNKTTHPNFSVALETRAPEGMVDDTVFFENILFKDLIVISAGMGLQSSTSKFQADIPNAVKEKILEAAGSEYQIPIIVDLSIINGSNKITKSTHPVLYSLVMELIDNYTSYNVSIENGGVSGNIYAYDGGVIQARSFASKQFNSYTIPNANVTTSPYFDVYNEISEENVFRSTYKARENLLPLNTTEAACIRSAINYAGHRVRGLKSEIRVLDIEPYTSRSYLSKDGTENFTDKELKLKRIETLSAMKVLSWLPSQYVVKTTDGQGYIYGSTKEIRTEKQAAQVIKITTMSVAELNTWNQKLVENFDMIYIGASVDNLYDVDNPNATTNRGYIENGAWSFRNNDPNLGGDVTQRTGLIYTSIGDTFNIGNVNYNDSIGGAVDGTVDVRTIAGLLREDYVGLINVKDNSGSNKLELWNLPASYVTTMRPSGNDVTKAVQLQLQEFAATGLPVIFADELCTVPQSTEYSINVASDSYFRRIKDGRDQYFVYFNADLEGDLPTGVSIVWEWRYYNDAGQYMTIPSKFKYSGDGNTKIDGVKKRTESSTVEGNISGMPTSVKGNDCEPIGYFYDEKTHKRSTTLGFIKPDGTIGYDPNDGYVHYEGMTVPDFGAGNRYWQNHEFNQGSYQVVAKFVVDSSASATKKALYNGKQIFSSKYSLTLKDSQFNVKFTVMPTSSQRDIYSGKDSSRYTEFMTLEVSPNPFSTYVPHMSRKLSGYDYYDEKFYRADPSGGDITDKLPIVAGLNRNNWNADKIDTDDSDNAFEDHSFTIGASYNAESPNSCFKGGSSVVGNDNVGLHSFSVDVSDKNKITYKIYHKDKSHHCTFVSAAKYAEFLTLWVNGRAMVFGANKVSGKKIYGTQVGSPIVASSSTVEQTYSSVFKYQYPEVVLKEAVPPTVIKVDSVTVDKDVVDNTSNLYQFMSQVYDEYTTTEAARNAAAEKGYLLQDRVGLSNVMSIYDITQDGGARLGSALALSPPSLIVDERSLQEYNEKNPQTLSNNTLRVTFRVNCDMDSVIRDNETKYYVYLYIDANHDAVYSANERVPITTLKEKSGGIAPKKDGVYVINSSTSDEKRLYEYVMEKQIPSTYQGILPWKLEIVDTANSYFHDSFTGYSYMRQDAPTTIKCLQILPSDQYSNNKNEVMGYGREFEDHEYTIRGAWKKTKNTMEEGNVYLGSVFMGIDSKYKYVFSTNDTDPTSILRANIRDYDAGETIYTRQEENASNGKTDAENDAFYQLTLEEGSRLKRTIYYEEIAGTEYYEDDDAKNTSTSYYYYRTHVVLWVNAKGDVQYEKDSNTGAVLKDYFGKEIEYYQDCDFKVDIALTDIYELDAYIYNCQKSYDMNKDYLNQYDMLILGFSDSYGKYRTSEDPMHITTTLGFSQYASWAISDYINAGKPVLFCHDTLNSYTNFLNYLGDKVLSLFTDAVNEFNNFVVQTLVPEAVKVWTSIKNWWYDITKQYDKKVDYTVSEEIQNNVMASFKDSRVKDGYYNNLLMRTALRQDKYGITYAINKAMDDTKTYKLSNDNIVVNYTNKDNQTHWMVDGGNYKAGHYFTWMLGTTKEDGTKIFSMEAVATYASGVDKDCYVTTPEMLGENFSIANQPNSAYQIETGTYVSVGEPLTVNAYKYYTDDMSKVNNKTLHSGEYEYVKTTDRQGNKETEMRYYNNYTTYDIQDPVTGQINNVLLGGQVQAAAVKHTQGFTKWTITKFQTDQSKAKNTYYPVGVKPTSGHDVFLTTAIQQVNKGSLTSYPYDINSYEFGGTTGDEATGKITINPTHEQVYMVNFNADDVTVWYTLADPIGTSKENRNYDLVPKDGANSYYIYSSGNLVYTGAGHTNCFTLLEAKLFINTLVAAYRLSEEIPSVTYRDEEDEIISVRIVPSEDTKTYDQRNAEVTAPTNYDKYVVVGVKAVDPNISGSVNTEGQLKIQFGSEIEGQTLKADSIINVGTLYTECKNGKLSGTQVANKDGMYYVQSDVTYYFYVPESEINKLKDNQETIVYVQSSLNNGASLPVKLQIRRTVLDVLS